VAAEIVAASGKARAFQADVRDAERRWRGWLTKWLPRSGASTAWSTTPSRPSAGHPGGRHPQDFQTAFDFGCKAVVNTITARRPVMRDQGGGRVVNIVTELWNLAPATWSV